MTAKVTDVRFVTLKVDPPPALDRVGQKEKIEVRWVRLAYDMLHKTISAQVRGVGLNPDTGKPVGRPRQVSFAHRREFPKWMQHLANKYTPHDFYALTGNTKRQNQVTSATAAAYQKLATHPDVLE